MGQTASINSLFDRAYSQGVCPHCNFSYSSTDHTSLPRHLRDCEAYRADLSAHRTMARKKTKWACHPEHGGVMLLQIEKGLAAVENGQGRYVVRASELNYKVVSGIITQIEKACPTDEQLSEIIAYLIAKVRIANLDIVLPVGCEVEFKKDGKILSGIVESRRGRSYGVRHQARLSRVGRNSIIRVVGGPLSAKINLYLG